ncbi:MAG TPA: hypothetical protein VG457_17455, partial [Planctomycetota bacterium]|nr:hypothetical protein [Planctomycetota bacterium]
MRTWTALVSAAVFAVLAHRSANAQERDPAPKKDRPPAPRRFFDRPIDYWQQGLILENRPFDAAQAVPPPPPDPTSKQGPSEWSRRAQRPDGTFATEELPRPLVQVLEDPSPENVRAYFE